MTRVVRALFGVAMGLLAVAPLGAQTPAQLKQELDALKQRVDAQQKEIDALKAQRPGTSLPSLDRIELKLDKAPMRGNAAARVVLVEVSDFECPFCARHVRQTAGQIEKAYIDSGKARHAYVNFPLASHRNAFKAAEAGLCAGDQGKFWEMHARMFASQTQLAPPLLPGLAGTAGVNVEQLRACLDGGRKREQVSSDQAMAQRAGVTATPTFFVGVLDAKTGAFTVTERIIGAKQYGVFQQALDAALARK
ncbi:MAG: thioredoxin domain-containing protein [Vicinamibacterales bacterium]